MKLNQIVEKKQLNQVVYLMGIYNPAVANKAKAGQFVIFKHKESERIPLTIADCNSKMGIVYIVFQQAGVSTAILSRANVGEQLDHFAGPLGNATSFEKVKSACVVAGGVGAAIAYPIAKTLHSQNAKVDAILGFRSKNLVFFEEKFQTVADTHIVTDDGSYAQKGLVTDSLEQLLNTKQYDCVFVVGPLPMMKAVANLTKEYSVKTIASMNPIMIDGTGMCGGCRLTVDGKTKFACVDGPDFDAHKVDFDQLIARNKTYQQFERHAYDKYCNLLKK